MSSETAIIEFLRANPDASRAQIRAGVAPDNSEATVWRALRGLVERGALSVVGKGRATRYSLAGTARIRAHLDAPYYERVPVGYRREFLEAYVPGETAYLSDAERAQLTTAGAYPESLPPGTYARRILTRLLVDLAWASSRMEGNTYEILETERLIEAGHEASGRDRAEALMILNHKDAIEYVVDHLADADVDRRTLFDLHALLANGLLYDPAMSGRLRRLPVSIGRSAYLPLEDEFDVTAQFDAFLAKAAAIANPFEQSFFVLVHLPYLQPFADVNKRTSRIAANVPLLKAGLAPLSFVATDDQQYVDGLLGVYELNEIALLKQVYLASYLATARQYTALRAQMDTPPKSALTHRDFVRQAVRNCVLEWGSFRRERVLAMAASAGIPTNEHNDVASYVEGEVNGLHEGNAIRYGIPPESVARLQRR